MHNLFLWDHPILSEMTMSEKNRRINQAVEASRKIHPINRIKTITYLFVFVIFPMICFTYFYSFNLGVIWALASTFFMNYASAKKELPSVKQHLEQLT